MSFTPGTPGYREWRRNYDREWRKANPDKIKEYSRRSYVKHRQRNIERTQRWRAANREKAAEYLRWYHINKKYGVSKEQYEELIRACNGLCQICHSVPKEFHIDHCHKTNRVRGILCETCNLGLGLFKDSPDFLYAAAAYLKDA